MHRTSDPGRQGWTSFDPSARLLRERIVLIGQSIDDGLASDVIAQMRHLEAEDPNEPISFHINSSGGEAAAGLAVYDAMQSIGAEVSTLCLGAANGVASLLLAAGAPGKRQAMFHARILLQHPAFSFDGRAADVEAKAREVLAMRTRIEELYAEHTGQSIDRIHGDMERGQFFGALEAQEYGLIDRIVTGRPDGPPASAKKPVP